jgi:hypothetical protein
LENLKPESQSNLITIIEWQQYHAELSIFIGVTGNEQVPSCSVLNSKLFIVPVI